MLLRQNSIVQKIPKLQNDILFINSCVGFNKPQRFSSSEKCLSSEHFVNKQEISKAASLFLFFFTMHITLKFVLSLLVLSLAFTCALENWKTHNDQLKKVLNQGISQLWIKGLIPQFYQKWFSVQCQYQPPCYDDKEYIPIEDAKGILYQILSTQKIRFCAEIKKPILFYNESNQLVGVENDIMNALIQELNEYYNTNFVGEWVIKETTSFFNNMTTALNNNECDAILSFVSFKKERALC